MRTRNLRDAHLADIECDWDGVRIIFANGKERFAICLSWYGVSVVAKAMRTALTELREFTNTRINRIVRYVRE